MNEVNSELHKLTGVEQRITSAYHAQSNRLLERLNRTIKNSLVKLLENNSSKWPCIVKGILLAYRTSRHFSTIYSFFKMMQNREPVLPVDFKYNLDKNENCNFNEERFDFGTYDAVFSSTNKFRVLIFDNASENLKNPEKNRNEILITNIFQKRRFA